MQVWNSDTLEEARKAIQSELVSDEPEMRLLYTTPGMQQPPLEPGQLVPGQQFAGGRGAQAVRTAAASAYACVHASMSVKPQALRRFRAALACLCRRLHAESLRQPTLRGYLKVCNVLRVPAGWSPACAWGMRLPGTSMQLALTV